MFSGRHPAPLHGAPTHQIIQEHPDQVMMTLAKYFSKLTQSYQILSQAEGEVRVTVQVQRQQSLVQSGETSQVTTVSYFFSLCNYFKLLSTRLKLFTELVWSQDACASFLWKDFLFTVHYSVLNSFLGIDKPQAKSQSNPKGKGEFGLWAVT